MPSRSAQNVEYFAFSDDSSMTTSRRLPALLRPCTKPSKAASSRERSHRMLIWVAVIVHLFKKLKLSGDVSPRNRTTPRFIACELERLRSKAPKVFLCSIIYPTSNAHPLKGLNKPLNALTRSQIPQSHRYNLLLQHVLPAILPAALPLPAMGIPRETSHLLLLRHRSRRAIVPSHCTTDPEIFQ